MKKVMLICAPVSSRSGYGDHARDLVRSFLNLDNQNLSLKICNNLFKIDIKIFAQDSR